MKYFGGDLSEQHKQLNAIIRNQACLEQAKELFLDLHANLNLSAVSHSQANSLDRFQASLLPDDYSKMPTAKDQTIAWTIWHIARIEDVTIQMLVRQQDQIFNEEWKNRIHTKIADTGNAMKKDEIISFSKNIDPEELWNYRTEVAKQTRIVVCDLQAADMRRPVEQEDLDRILHSGGVTTQKESIGLLDYWGGKDVAGLLLMPPTRHVIGHLNHAFQWKEQIDAGKKMYLE